MNASNLWRSLLRRRSAALAIALGALLFAAPAFAQFTPYTLSGTFSLPGSGTGPIDVTPGGRIIALDGTTVYRETAPGAHTFVALGSLAGADFNSFGASFVRVSPDGLRFAVGNNGGASFSHFQVGVFQIASLTGTWFDANSFDGKWISNHQVALTAGTVGSPSIVTVLDTLSPNPASPSNRTIINNIGGASGGIAFDIFGNLYTGNGFSTTGPSGTGTVRAFTSLAWHLALLSGVPLNFETQGVLIIDVLSASSLGFDNHGNFLAAGGDFSGGDIDYAAVARRADVVQALLGNGPVNPSNPNQVQKLDPDTTNPSDFYSITSNHANGELYLINFGSPTVWFFN